MDTFGPMAKAAHILAGFTGSVGPVVGYYREGSYYIRSKPARRTKPPGEAELMARARMKLTNALLTALRPFVHVNSAGVTKTTANAKAFKYLYHEVVTSGIAALDNAGFARIMIDFGTLPPLKNMYGIQVGSQIECRWQPDDTEAASSDDIIALIAIATDLTTKVFMPACALRQAGQAKITLPEGEWAVYYASREAAGTNASAMGYLGTYKAI